MQADKLDFKAILPIFVIVLVDLLGLTIIIPLLPLYATAFGASPLLIGALGSVYPVMQFVAAPILGGLSDRFGRKPVLLISQIGTFVGFVLLGLAQGLPLLFVSRLIDGLSGANISTAQAVISDRTTERTRTQAMGLIGAAFGLGFTVGPVIAFASLAASGNNYAIPAFIAAGFSLLSIVLTAVWLQESLPAERRAEITAEHQRQRLSPAAMFGAVALPGIGFLLLLMFVQQGVFFSFEQLLPLFTLNRMGMNASGNAGVFVFVGIISVIVQGGLVRVWSKKYGDRWLILLGISTMAVGLLLTALTPAQALPSYSRAALQTELRAKGEAENTLVLPSDDNKGLLGIGWLLVAMIPASIGGAVLSPTINSAISKQAKPNEIGRMLGLSSAFSSAANAITPVLGGAIYQYAGMAAPFIIGPAILVVFFIMARQRVTNDKPKPAMA